MNVRPHQSAGIIRKSGDQWLIELPDKISGVEEGTPVRIVFWDDRPKGGRSDLEEIARVQQIEIEIVAKGLSAEGAIADDKEAFLARLSQAVA
jgi:hypothetical protein